MTDRVFWLGLSLAIVMILGVGGCVVNARLMDCHAKGGEIHWLEQSGGMCLTPDGRIVR